MFVLLLLAACDNRPRLELEATKAAALQRLAAIDEPWAADARITLPLDSLSSLVHVLLNDALTRTRGVSAGVPGLGVGLVVEPRFQVESLALRPDPQRPEGALADVVLVGRMGAKLGGRELGLPIRVTAVAKVRLEIEDSGSVVARIDGLTDVAVESGGWRSRQAKTGTYVEEWLQGVVRDRPIRARIARVGGQALPVLRARLEVTATHVQIDLRTDVVGEGPPLPRAEPGPDGEVTLSARTFTALVRREVWEKHAEGTLPFLDPTSIHLGPDHVVAEVRLWNPTWPVWWQDFHAAGPLRLEDGRVHVQIEDLVPGSGQGGLWSTDVIADPVRLALGETLSGRLAASLPGELEKRVHGVHLDAHVLGLADLGDAFVVRVDVTTDAGDDATVVVPTAPAQPPPDAPLGAGLPKGKAPKGPVPTTPAP